MSVVSEEQTAQAEIEIGSFRARASVRATPAGLIAIGVLVASVLFSTRALVATAIRERTRLP